MAMHASITRIFSAMKITASKQRNVCLKVIIPGSRLPSPQTLVTPEVSLLEEQAASRILFSSRISPPINAPTYHHIIPVIEQIKDPARDVGVVLDPAVADRVIGDSALETGVIGDDPTLHRPAIEARHIQKIRRWHMNRHHLKKRRKKHRMMFWNRRYIKAKRKRENLRVDVEAIKKDGEQFDALAFVQQRLERARRGGFKQDFWSSAKEQPEVPWREYAPLPRKWRAYEPSAEYKIVKKKLMADRDRRRMKLKQMKRRLTFKN